MSNEQDKNGKDFVSEFIKFYALMESPTSFWRWSSYALIAATLRNKVYYEYGTGKIYPNIYVILLADSAEYRKGAPIIASRTLLNLIKITKVFSGTASIQGILDDLSQDVADRKSGIPIKGGSCIITADELAAFFVADTRLIPLITDMWDYREEYPYKLKSNTVIIKDLCTTMLAASNETFLREVYDPRALYGGLLGRTFMIKPDETREPNSLMYMNLEGDYDKKRLTDLLEKIKKLNGPVTKTKEAAKYYDNWYRELYKKYKTHPDKTGVLQRMHTNVIKLALILSAANYSLEITEEIFAESISQCTSLRPNYELYVIGAGKSSLADIASKFLKELWESEKHIIGRREFLGKYFTDITAEDFDKLLTTMQTGDIIELVVSGVEIKYKLTSKGIGIFQKHQEKEKLKVEKVGS